MSSLHNDNDVSITSDSDIQHVTETGNYAMFTGCIQGILYIIILLLLYDYKRISNLICQYIGDILTYCMGILTYHMRQAVIYDWLITHINTATCACSNELSHTYEVF